MKRLKAGLMLSLAASALVLSGCKTTEKINWSGRVGNYTYDQAVAEMGQPSYVTKLPDGSTRADWVKKGGGVNSTVSFSSNVYGEPAEKGVAGSGPVDENNRKISLTFNPQSVLSAWSTNVY